MAIFSFLELGPIPPILDEAPNRFGMSVRKAPSSSCLLCFRPTKPWQSIETPQVWSTEVHWRMKSSWNLSSVWFHDVHVSHVRRLSSQTTFSSFPRAFSESLCSISYVAKCKHSLDLSSLGRDSCVANTWDNKNWLSILHNWMTHMTHILTSLQLVITPETHSHSSRVLECSDQHQTSGNGQNARECRFGFRFSNTTEPSMTSMPHQNTICNSIIFHM